MNPEKFSELVNELIDEGTRFAKDYKKFKTSFFSQLAKEVRLKQIMSIIFRCI
jgi:hypothetical protein